MPLKTRPWTIADYLDNDEAASAYLDACLEDGDTALIAAALGDIAHAKGITDLAERTGLSVDAVDQALSANGDLEFSIVLKIVAALGLKLVARQKALEVA